MFRPNAAAAGKVTRNIEEYLKAPPSRHGNTHRTIVNASR
jgi:hypothetical protein